jgi:transmembrane sensor
MANSLQIEEAAAAWLAKRDRGDWTDSDQANFEQWRLACIAHRVAFARLEAVWLRTNHLKGMGAGAVPGIVPSPQDWRLALAFEHATPTDIAAADGNDDTAEGP